MFKDLRIPLTAVALAIAGAMWVGLPQGDDTASALDALMPAAGGAVSVASHKALYDYKMVSVESGAGVSGIKGKMYYEQDDACDAWTTDQRFTTEYHYPERKPVVSGSHYVAWEAKDGSLFHFSSERQENGVMTEQLRGSVARAEDGSAKAEYSRPDDLSFDLPKGYVLPTLHTTEIIRKAQAGEKLYNAVLFDGTDADGPVEMNAFIGKKATAEEIAAARKDKPGIDASLLTPDAWHVRIALFPLEEKEGQEKDGMSPSYEMDMILHDNTVVSWSLVDYKSFKVEQFLSALEKLPQKSCP